MRKGKKEYSRKRYKPNRKKDALDDYDIKNFMVDNALNRAMMQRILYLQLSQNSNIDKLF